MKGTLFIILLASISCVILQANELQTVRNKIVNKIKENVRKDTYPSDYRNYILKFFESIDYIFDFIDVSELDKKLPSYHLPNSVSNAIKAVRYLSAGSSERIINFQNSIDNKEDAVLDDYLGLALKYEDFVVFGALHTVITGKKKTLFQTVTEKKCQRKWYCLWICKKCWKESHQEPRAYTNSEVNKVRLSVLAKSADTIKAKLKTY